MGGSESSFKRNYEETVSELSSVQLREITTHFHEVYAKAGGSKGHLVDREAFSKYFKLPVSVGERLFEAFDAHKNGKISFEEFVCGLAVLLHGSFSNKCQLLFQVFNIHGDEGISREELATMLHAILHSTNTIVMAVSQIGGVAGGGTSAVMEGENREQAIRAMVDSAFRNCDITGTGKLLPLEFEYWVRKHPQILDTLLSFKPHGTRGTLGSLLLSSETDGASCDPTVSVPLHPSPLPPSSFSSLPLSSASSQGSLEVTHTTHIRTIRSEPMLVTTGTDKQSHPEAEQESVTLETSDSSLDTAPLEVSKVAPSELDELEETGVNSGAVTIEIGASSPTLVLESDVTSENTKILVSPQSDEEHEEHLVMVAPSGSKREEEEEEEAGGGGRNKEEGVSEEVNEDDEEKEVVSPDNLAIEEERVAEERGEDREEVNGEKLVLLEEEVGQEVMVDEDEDNDGRTDDATAKEGDSEGETQAGSIMQSHDTISGMNFDLPEAPLPTDSAVPSSPLLPTTTTMETIALESQELTTDIQLGIVEDDIRREPLSLPEEMGAVGGTQLQLNEPQQIEDEELNTVGGHLLEQGVHQLEISNHQPLQNAEGTHLLEMKEAGIGLPLHPLQVEISLPPSALPTHLSDPLISLPLSPPSLPSSHPQSKPPNIGEESQTLGGGGGGGGGGGDEGVGDVGPEPRVLPSQPSPFPEEVAGVKESLYTAWIPSGWTLDLLSRRVTVDQSHLTCPGLVADIKMHDPIGELLMTHSPSTPRKTLPSVEGVPMDMVGLRKLVREGCYHTALELTGRFLSAHGQGLGQAGQPSLHTHKTLQMWGARLALLVAMHQFREAETEMEAFGDLMNPDLYYQYHTHNYPDKAGSMVPFSMRLLHAQLPSYTGNHQLSLDRLCSLQHTCQQVVVEVKRGFLPFVRDTLTSEDQQVAEDLWMERLTRVKFCLANTLVAMQEYLLAIEVYEWLLEQLPNLRIQLLSVMGRLHLTLGDLPSAQALYTLASSSSSSSSSSSAGDEENEEEEENRRMVQSHINQGLVNVFLCRWQLAKDCFDSALQLEPTNLSLRNNIAVCTFYQGHLKECISDLEGVVNSRLPTSLQPALLANLTAAYDLESSSAYSKKLSFLPLLGQHVGEGFPLSSLGLR